MEYKSGQVWKFKQPNQYKGKFLFRVKSFIKRHLAFQGKLVVLSTILAITFTLGQWSEPEHITAQTIVEKNTTFPPMLQKICKAESGGRQFKENGRVVRGKINPSDIGICQINEPIWNDKAIELGYDIYKEQGNKDMALWLFNNYGSEPWNSSKPVWSKMK